MALHVLVTGGNGFVGKALALHLFSAGLRVRVSTRRALSCTALNRDWIHTTDVSSLTDWSAALTAIDAVVHCAARVHVMNDTEVDPLNAFRAVNVHGTLNLARQAAAAGIKRFVFISSAKVNGEHTVPGRAFTEVDQACPQDAYGLSKHEAEQGLRLLAANTGMEVVIVRPPLIYGPGVKANFAALVQAVQRGWPLPLGAVHNQRSLIALDNLVDFIGTCISNPYAANQTFLVSDGHDLSTNQLVRSIAQAAEMPVRLVPVPVWALVAGGRLMGRGDVVQRLCGNFQVNIKKAREMLGWTPLISVEEGLRRAIHLSTGT